MPSANVADFPSILLPVELKILAWLDNNFESVALKLFSLEDDNIPCMWSLGPGVDVLLDAALALESVVVEASCSSDFIIVEPCWDVGILASAVRARPPSLISELILSISFASNISPCALINSG